MLDKDDQQTLIELLKVHPQFEKDFKIPESDRGAEESRLWLAGRAGYWPDVARESKVLNRPTWHYQLGSSLVLGNANLVKVHVTPPDSPGDATLETQELQITQALKRKRTERDWRRFARCSDRGGGARLGPAEHLLEHLAFRIADDR